MCLCQKYLIILDWELNTSRKTWKPNVMGPDSSGRVCSITIKRLSFNEWWISMDWIKRQWPLWKHNEMVWSYRKDWWDWNWKINICWMMLYSKRKVKKVMTIINGCALKREMRNFEKWKVIYETWQSTAGQNDIDKHSEWVSYIYFSFCF